MLTWLKVSSFLAAVLFLKYLNKGFAARTRVMIAVNAPKLATTTSIKFCNNSVSMALSLKCEIFIKLQKDEISQKMDSGCLAL
jgi:hypothetical protein